MFTDKSEVFSFLTQFNIFNFLFIIGSKISNYHQINDKEHDLSNDMETLKFGTLLINLLVGLIWKGIL